MLPSIKVILKQTKLPNANLTLKHMKDLMILPLHWNCYSFMPESIQIYHPFRLISCTLLTVALKDSLNLFRHLSVASLFLFNPGLSWNRCLLKSCFTRFMLHLIFNVWNALAKSMLRSASTSTVRPKLGFMRILGGSVSIIAPPVLVPVIKFERGSRGEA